MFKNLSIRQITIISTIAIVLLIMTILLFTHLFVQPLFLPSRWIEMLILFLLGGLGAYFILSYFLDVFIYRKIKLVYKIIRKSKIAIVDQEMSVADEDLLTSAEDEVVKWAEDKQKEIDSLRALETYRRDYVGNLSHELKTPIFNLQGYIHTLLDGALDDHKVLKYYLTRASKNLERLQNIVQDLDLIAKIESNVALLDLVSFNIKNLAKEVFEHLEMQASQKKITLKFKEGADKSFHVKADRENIRQVFINLVLNAIKYGKENGYVKVSFYDMERYILVEVSDNGLGIDEKHFKHLFDRFYRVEKSRSRQAGGTGLGLAIVKHIIEAHKQTINVRSTIGEGSTFGFTLSKA